MKKVYFLIIALTAALSVSAQECVDLGLSVNWASCNLGAEQPTDIGALYYMGSGIEFIPGVINKDIKIVDHNKDFSGDPNLDPSTQCWGAMWRTPTSLEWEELINRCTWKYYNYVDDRGIECKGYEITGPNGNRILLPANYFARQNGTGLYQTSTPKHKSKKIDILLFSKKKIFVQPWKYNYMTVHVYGVGYRPVTNK